MELYGNAGIDGIVAELTQEYFRFFILSKFNSGQSIYYCCLETLSILVYKCCLENLRVFVKCW